MDTAAVLLALLFLQVSCGALAATPPGEQHHNFRFYTCLLPVWDSIKGDA
jgi:hypothetical protein